MLRRCVERGYEKEQRLRLKDEAGMKLGFSRKHAEFFNGFGIEAKRIEIAREK